MKRQIIITYEWERADKGPTESRHTEQLEAFAEGKILENMDFGDTEGELSIAIDTNLYLGKWEATKF